ncbi:type III secretion system YopN/LcrE/InvE/MxiC family regulator [Oxalobacteraceae bacterium GrIS 2.11]
MLKIDSVAVSRPPVQSNNTAEAKQHKTAPTPAEKPVNESTTVSYSDLYSIADDMSAVMAQFRRRSDAEKRAASATDPFERILEDDSEHMIEGLHVISRAAEVSTDSFLAMARSMFPDDSDVVLVLRELIRRRKVGNIDTSALEDLLEEVWEKSNKKLCQAGLNIGLKARLYSRKMKVSPKSLRNTYREFLISDEGELFQYEQWVEQYGADRRGTVAEFIETSLMHDMHSHDPSCSRREFGGLLGHLMTVKKLQESDTAFLQVFLRGNLKLMLIENELLTCWFDCLQRPFKLKKEIEKNDMNNLTQTLFLTKPELQKKLLMAIRQIHSDLFMEPEVKQILIDSLLNFPHKKLEPTQ